jgi:hypothetical protein
MSLASSIARVIDDLLAVPPRPAGTSPLALPHAEAVIHPNWAQDDQLDTAVRHIAQDLGFADRLFAVVDFTNIPRRPSGAFDTTPAPLFAAWNGRQETRIASMAKLAIMYAAFQLLADLRRHSLEPAARDEAALQQLARQAWAGAPEPLVRRILDDTQVRDLDRKVRTLRDGPDLTTMFDIRHLGSSWVIMFTTTGEDATELDKIDDLGRPVPDPANPGHTMEDPTYRPRVAILGFLQRLQLTIGWSNDVAAASCVRDIGFPYIEALLAQSGLLDPGRDPAGLFLGSNYDGFEVGHVPSQNFADGSTQTSQAGTAEALARFMTLLLQGRLVDEDSSMHMKALLAKDTSEFGGTLGTRSFALEGVQLRFGLPPVFTAPARAHSKIGLLLQTNQPTSTVHAEASDVASIVRQLDDDVGTELRYVVFAFGSAVAAARVAAETSAITVVRSLAANLDQVLVDRHSESSP